MSDTKGKKESEGPSRCRFKTICVFGGSKLGKDRELVKAATELGSALATRKISLVYGGGSLGLKGCVASFALTGGSKVMGIVQKHQVVRNDTSPSLGCELRVSSIHEKMGSMLFNADAFIALPGGLGTLEEIFDVASWAQLNIHKKPLGLLNVNGFYNGLLSFLDHAVEQELMSQATRCIIVSALNVDQLIDHLQTCVPEPTPSIHQVDWDTDESNKKRELDTTLRL